jgi:hypothetical protein
MPVDSSAIINYLSAISSIAVILGAIFVVFQLRQNSREIELQVRQNRANIALALLDKLTDQTFPARRKRMHDSIKKAIASNWEGFDDSMDDFEARNFAYIYELIGQLARENVVDVELLRSALQTLVIADWDAFSPLTRHLMEKNKSAYHSWKNFEWLATENRKSLQDRKND